MTPRVSICVPNLNTLPYLEERFDCILGQTYRNFEVFVYDSYSDDGAWEFLQRIAARDDRVRLMQGPRRGPYPAWNECLRHTTGELVYIATSDDTMALDCIEKMAGALERHGDCDLAHCPLRIVDGHTRPIVPPPWPANTVFASGAPDLVDRPHVRRAPYDGLLHLSGRHVYLSIAQLLIRRSLFSKVGPFLNRWGNISDFNWEMRAGLVASTVHVPGTWASWRIHEKQATHVVNFESPERDRKIEQMIADAVESCDRFLPRELSRSPWLDRTRNIRNYYARLAHEPSARKRRIFQLGQLLAGAPGVRSEIINVLSRGKKWPIVAPGLIRSWIEDSGFGPTLEFSEVAEQPPRATGPARR